MAIVSEFTIEKGPNLSKRIPSNGIDYPLHFFNQLCFTMPETKKEMFVWARRLTMSHGIMDRIIDIFSRYPITKVMAISEDEQEDGFWSKTLNEDLSIQTELIANGKDYYTYGNCFVSVIPPFERYLKCEKCGMYMLHNISQNENALDWKFVDYKFIGTCRGCKHKGTMKPLDEYLVGAEAIKKIVIHRWPPINITVRDMPLTGRKRIFYTLENKYVEGIKRGDKFTVSSVPLDFIKAVSKSPNKVPTIELIGDSTYHYKYETTTEPESDGMARPFFMPAWKDVFMTLVLRKAQECIVAEHMVPRKFVFPQPLGNSDIFTNVDGEVWKSTVVSMLKRMQNDPNDIGVLPAPMGYQQIGGDGKHISITEIIEYTDRRIITMLGMPSELMYGGMQYSGMNVSLRMLENFFLNYMKKQENFLAFLVNAISNKLRIPPPVQVKLAKFRLADDVAENNNLLMLGAQQRVSPTTALSGMGIDLEAEAKQSRKDGVHLKAIFEAYQSPQAVAAQNANDDAGVITDQNQGRAYLRQQDMQATMNSAPGNSLTYTDPEWRRNELSRMSSQRRAEMLTQEQAQMSPDAWARRLQEATSNVDPQPVQKPPTRNRVK